MVSAGTVRPPPSATLEGVLFLAREPLSMRSWPNLPTWRTARKRVHWFGS